MKRIAKIISKLVLLTLLILTSNISIYAQDTEDITLPDVFPTEDAVWVILVTQTENNLRDVFEPYYKETTYRTSYYLLGDTSDLLLYNISPHEVVNTLALPQLLLLLHITDFRYKSCKILPLKNLILHI